MDGEYGNGKLDLYDPGLHIFVDDREVRHMQRVSRVWNQPSQRSEPVLEPQESWERLGTQPSMVMFDEAVGKFRCWYCVDYAESTSLGRSLVCYAESEDGIHWERPNLGIYEFQGSKANNICLAPKSMEPLDSMFAPTVFRDDDEPDPAARYKGVAFMQDTRMYEHRELWAVNHYLFTSPDGIHWSIPGRNIEVDCGSDRFVLARDQKRNLWIAMVGVSNLSGSVRMLGLRESADLKNWSEVIVPFHLTEEEGLGWTYDHHSLFPFVYGNQYLGFFDRYHKPTFMIHQQVVSSRDARHWERPMGERTFLTPGPEGSIDRDWLIASSHPPIPVDDELYIFYQAGVHVEEPPHIRMTLGLATLRRDGFVGLKHADKQRQPPGAVLTEPVEVTGPNLYVNAVRHADVSFKVEVRDVNNWPIEGLQIDDCLELERSGLREQIQWQRKGLQDLVGQKVTLMFEYSYATLYAYKFGD